MRIYFLEHNCVGFVSEDNGQRGCVAKLPFRGIGPIGCTGFGESVTRSGGDCGASTWGGVDDCGGTWA